MARQEESLDSSLPWNGETNVGATIASRFLCDEDRHPLIKKIEASVAKSTMIIKQMYIAKPPTATYSNRDCVQGEEAVLDNELADNTWMPIRVACPVMITEHFFRGTTKNYRVNRVYSRYIGISNYTGWSAFPIHLH